MSLNKVMLIGNLGENAEVRAVGQSQVAKFRIATTERFKAQDGTTKEQTEWHTCELWNSNGVYPYLVKGAQVYVEGAIRTNEWTDQQGQKRYSQFVRVLTLQLLGGKPQQTQQQQYAPQQPQYQQAPQQQYVPQQPTYQAPAQPQYAPQQPTYQAPQPQYAMPGGNDFP